MNISSRFFFMFSFFEEINFPLSKSAPKDKCVKMFKKQFSTRNRTNITNTSQTILL